MKFFDGCKTLGDVKSRYYELVKHYHPDKPENGTAEQDILKTVNHEYEIAFKIFKNTHQDSKGNTYTKETDEIPDQFKEIINKVIRLENVFVEVCGSWIWLTGNTKPYKDYLKENGFKWSSKKFAWHWHTGEFKKWSKSECSLDEIRVKYGSHSYKSEKNDRLQESR